MKKTLFLLFVSLFAFSLSASAETENKGVYMFGWAQCLNDTVVYVSAIQHMPTATIEGSQLVDRAAYGTQFKGYLELAETTPHMTACVFYAKSLSSLEKTLDKLCRKTLKKKDFGLKKISAEEFKFQSLTY